MCYELVEFCLLCNSDLRGSPFAKRYWCLAAHCEYDNTIIIASNEHTGKKQSLKSKIFEITTYMLFHVVPWVVP